MWQPAANQDYAKGTRLLAGCLNLVHLFHVKCTMNFALTSMVGIGGVRVAVQCMASRLSRSTLRGKQSPVSSDSRPVNLRAGAKYLHAFVADLRSLKS